VSTALCLHDEAPPTASPFVRCWNETALPVRVIRAPAKIARHPLQASAPAWMTSGPTDQPFEFCERIGLLCADISYRCKVLDHVDVSRILFATTQARSGRTFGLQARVTPLRFHDGTLIKRRGNRSFQVQRYFVGTREMLYVMTFCLPRFLDQDFDDKLITLFHELYHISPSFDGDLRRHEGRYALHSHSKRSYDEHMAHLARAYLQDGADPALHAFLRLNFAQLQHRHGEVLGVVVPRPKLVPVPTRR
jgi:hypothetical protein